MEKYRAIGLEMMMVWSNSGKAFYTVLMIIFKPVKKVFGKEILFHFPLSH